MRFMEKPPVLEKIKKGFLFLPKNINGVIRWLEFAEWKIRFQGDGGGMMGGRWQDVEWLDIGSEQNVGCQSCKTK